MLLEQLEQRQGVALEKLVAPQIRNHDRSALHRQIDQIGKPGKGNRFRGVAQRTLQGLPERADQAVGFQGQRIARRSGQTPRLRQGVRRCLKGVSPECVGCRRRIGFLSRQLGRRQDRRKDQRQRNRQRKGRSVPGRGARSGARGVRDSGHTAHEIRVRPRVPGGSTSPRPHVADDPVSELRGLGERCATHLPLQVVGDVLLGHRTFDPFHHGIGSVLPAHVLEHHHPGEDE